jgi:hypothetical protein
MRIVAGMGVYGHIIAMFVESIIHAEGYSYVLLLKSITGHVHGAAVDSYLSVASKKRSRYGTMLAPK